MNELYRGIVRGRFVELEGEELIPEGTRVTVIPEESAGDSYSMDAWLLEARKARALLPFTSDSVEILKEIRQERADK